MELVSACYHRRNVSYSFLLLLYGGVAKYASNQPHPFFFDLNVSPENISRCNRQRLFFPLFNQRIPSVASRRFDKRKMMFWNCFFAPLLIGILSAERQKTGWCYQSLFKVVPFPDGNRICSSDPSRLTCHYETGEDIVEYPLTKASDYCHQ